MSTNSKCPKIILQIDHLQIELVDKISAILIQFCSKFIVQKFRELSVV